MCVTEMLCAFYSGYVLAGCRKYGSIVLASGNLVYTCMQIKILCRVFAWWPVILLPMVLFCSLSGCVCISGHTSADLQLEEQCRVPLLPSQVHTTSTCM